MFVQTRSLMMIGAAAVILAWSVTAGDLDPPAGPITSTMKSLDTIEPRTPIFSLPLIITTPGSYFLTGNLSTPGHGIVVNASDVTIDLMGFTITGPGPSSSSGIELASLTHQNLTVRNGTVRSFEYGVVALEGETLARGGVTVEHVRVLDIGLYGIDLRARNNLVRDCFAEVSATPSHSGTNGIVVTGGVITGCRAHGFGTGFAGVLGAVISDSVATGCSTGIICSQGVVNGCTATGSTSQNLFLIGDAVSVNTYAP